MNAIILFFIIFTALVIGVVILVRKNRMKKKNIPPATHVDDPVDHVIRQFEDL
jgi:hypothetical protein